MDIREYYRNLLIIQYNDKPKASATINAIYDSLMPINSETGNILIDDIRDAFDVENAVGVQLDIIGNWVGINRLYKGQNLDDIVAYGYTDQFGTEYIDVVGMSIDSSFFSEEGTFVGAEEVISTTNKLTDSDFRFLIKLKIAQNNIDHSNYAIDEVLNNLFGSDLYYIDNLDMTMTYFVDQSRIKLVPVMIEKDLFLRPMTVGIQSVIIDGQYFGFLDADNIVDLDDNSGFSSADTFLTDEGLSLGIEDIIV